MVPNSQGSLFLTVGGFAYARSPTLGSAPRHEWMLVPQRVCSWSCGPEAFVLVNTHIPVGEYCDIATLPDQSPHTF